MEQAIKVLIIEDDPDDALLTREMLDESGNVLFDYITAERLSDGLECLAQGGVDFILLDLSLPDSQGLETLHRVRERAAGGLPIVVLTGLDDSHLAFQAIQQGADDYLVKSVMTAKPLVRAIRYTIERKKLQQAFHTIIEGNADAIVIVDEGGIIRFVNPAAEALFRKQSQGLIGEPFGFPLTLEEATEIEIKRGDRYVSAEMRVALIEWEKEQVLLATLRDVSDRKRAEEAKAQAFIAEARAREAEMANQAKSRFLSSMSHEMRTPLNAILGFSELLGDGSSGALSDLQRTQIEYIHKAGEHMLRLVENLLDLRRLEDDRRTLERVLLRLESCIGEALDLLTGQIRAKGHSVEVAVSGDLPPIPADRQALVQILNNLLSNAVKYTGRGGRIVVRAASDGRRLTLEVEDNGCGMAPEDHPHVFTFWQHIGGKNKHNMKGSGIGLALTHKLVEKLGGKITVQSDTGRGTIFTVILPINIKAGA